MCRFAPASCETAGKQSHAFVFLVGRCKEDILPPFGGLRAPKNRKKRMPSRLPSHIFRIWVVSNRGMPGEHDFPPFVVSRCKKTPRITSSAFWWFPGAKTAKTGCPAHWKAKYSAFRWFPSAKIPKGGCPVRFLLVSRLVSRRRNPARKNRTQPELQQGSRAWP